ncbi:MAG: GNAT family N-acetyltransferase [bacterium]
MDISIKPVTDAERTWVLEIARGWGADFVVTRGRMVYPHKIEGYYAEDKSGEKMGLVTFEIVGDQCGVVTLDAFRKWNGIGTALLLKARSEAKKSGCRRLWLITTNDNIEAIKFYQRRDMTIAAVHVNAMEHSRKLKPSIPEIGKHNIPLRDEIEFEVLL